MKTYKTKLTLSIDKEIIKKYKKQCKEGGLIISKQIENFMKMKLKKRR